MPTKMDLAEIVAAVVSVGGVLVLPGAVYDTAADALYMLVPVVLNTTSHLIPSRGPSTMEGVPSANAALG